MAKLILFALMAMASSVSSAKKLHYIHWNKNNPMFRLDNTDHIVEVNGGNLPWEYDQVNIICPVSKPGARFPETHVIYSVSREEFDSCRITNPEPKIVAICNNPYRLMYFTITFRSFTPTPGGLEFRPGQDYYFISTSSREDLHRRVGGGCATNNMKMIFKVADNGGNVEQHYADDTSENEILNGIEDSTKIVVDQDNEVLPFQRSSFYDVTAKRRVVHTPTTTTTTTQRPLYNAKAPSRDIYYYHPKDLLLEEDDEDVFSNELSQVWRQRQEKRALRLTSGSSSTSALTLVALLPVALAMLLA